VVDEVLGDEGELGEVAEDRLGIEGGRSAQRQPHIEGANGARLLAVGFEWWPTVRGGGPSLGGARGGCLGAARPTVVSSGARDAERSRATTREVGVVSEEERKVVECFSCSSNGGIRPWLMGFTWSPGGASGMGWSDRNDHSAAARSASAWCGARVRGR
jgi:hypothetical protein